jgi:hypothetical protein
MDRGGAFERFISALVFEVRDLRGAACIDASSCNGRASI